MAFTPLWCCGQECGIVTAAASQHWQTNTTAAGGTISSDTAIANTARGGVRALKVAQVGSAGVTQMQAPVAVGAAVGQIRFWLYCDVETTVSTWIWGWSTATGSTGTLAILLWDGSVHTMTASLNAATTVPTAFNVTTSRWYLIDIRYNVTGTTYLVDWWVDGVQQGQAAKTGQTGGTVGKPLWGISTSDTGTFHYDDMIYGSCAAGDPPIGDGGIRGAVPVASGTHSFTAGDFQDDASAAITIGELTSWSKLTSVPPTNTSFIKQVVIRSTGYVEYKYARIAGGQVPRAVEQVFVFHNITTLADTQSGRLWDGTTEAANYALQSAGSVAGTLGNRSKQFATAPTGAWTAALFDACSARWGFSTDVTDVPAFDMTIIEAEFPPIPRIDLNNMPPILAQ